MLIQGLPAHHGSLLALGNPHGNWAAKPPALTTPGHKTTDGKTHGWCPRGGAVLVGSCFRTSSPGPSETSLSLLGSTKYLSGLTLGGPGCKGDKVSPSEPLQGPTGLEMTNSTLPAPAPCHDPFLTRLPTDVNSKGHLTLTQHFQSSLFALTNTSESHNIPELGGALTSILLIEFLLHYLLLSTSTFHSSNFSSFGSGIFNASFPRKDT